MKQQVEHDHYQFNKYAHVERFASYYYQLLLVLTQEPETVLEVGVGDRVFCSYLRQNTSVSYTSFDLAGDLAPDIEGSVLDMSCDDDSYDVVCCFEVLEHLPYEEVDKALSELVRVARKAVVLSVPHFGPRVQLMLKVPFLPVIKVAAKMPWPRKHVFNGEHYWELGKKGYSVSVFRNLLERHGKLIEDMVPFENQYHHFFILEKDI